MDTGSGRCELWGMLSGGRAVNLLGRTWIPKGLAVLIVCSVSLTDLEVLGQRPAAPASEGVQKTRVDGRFAVRHLYSTADGPVSQDVSFTFFDTDFEGENLTSWFSMLVSCSTIPK